MALPSRPLSTFVVLLSLAGLAGVAAGCHAPRPSVRPGPAPRAETLLASLRAHQARAATLDARVRATSWLSGERLRATVSVLADRRGRLRFEAEVSLQGTVAILTTHDGTFASLDLQKNLLQRGPACPANVASLVKIPLSPEEVGAILLGDVALPSSATDDAAARVGWDQGRGLDSLTVPSAKGGTLVLFFEPNDQHRLRAAEGRGPDEKPRWRTAYDDFTDVALPEGRGNVALPTLVRFAEGTRSFDDGVDVKFKERRVGGPLADEAFVLRDPPGVTSVEVGCAEVSPP